MSSNTKIVVLRSKEIVYALVLLVVSVLIICLTVRLSRECCPRTMRTCFCIRTWTRLQSFHGDPSREKWLGRRLLMVRRLHLKAHILQRQHNIAPCILTVIKRSHMKMD